MSPQQPSLQETMEAEQGKLRDAVRKKIPDHIHVLEKISGYKQTTRQFSFEGRMEELYTAKARELIDAQLKKMEALATADTAQRQEIIRQTRAGLQFLRGQLERVLDVYTGKDRVFSLEEIARFERTVEPVLSTVAVEELVGHDPKVTELLQKLRGAELAQESGVDVLNDGEDLYPMLIDLLDERVFSSIAMQATKKKGREKAEAKETYKVALLVASLSAMTPKQRMTFVERVATSGKKNLTGKLFETFVGNGLIYIRQAETLLPKLAGALTQEEMAAYGKKLHNDEYQKMQTEARDLLRKAQKELKDAYRMNPALKYGDLGNLLAYEVGSHWGILVMILNVIVSRKDFWKNEYFWMGAGVTALTTEYATGGLGKGKISEWMAQPSPEKKEAANKERYRRLIEDISMNYPDVGDYFVDHFDEIDKVLKDKKQKTKLQAPPLDIEKDFSGNDVVKTLDHLEAPKISEYLAILYYLSTEVFGRRDRQSNRDHLEELKKKHAV